MKKKIIAVVSVALLVLSVLCIAPALAKYTTEQGKQLEIHSDVYYFTSDYLSESGIPEYKIYGDSVEFEIRNYIDSLRINAADIVYTVSAPGGRLSSDGGTLRSDGTEKKCDPITLSYSGEEVEKEIIVTVTSSSPYVKELKAKFIFAKSVPRYEITDSKYSYYAELYIHTADEAKTVQLFWNKEKLLIDETNDYVVGKLTANKNVVSIKIPAHTTVKIVFFKNDITEAFSCGTTRLGDTIHIPTVSEP